MAKAIRVLILLVVLATVAQEAWLARSRATGWKDPLPVALYPINADSSTATASYLDTLTPETFHAIEQFMDDEAGRHGVAIHRAVRIALAPPVASRPPARPVEAGLAGNILWSLRFRWWAWRHDRIAGFTPRVRLFLLYHDPAVSPHLPHSVGLASGLVGLVNVFARADMAGSNNVVIAHEMLHTLGATDKYDLTTSLPAFPDGYAEPGRSPRHPQDYAELMGGRIPKSDTTAEIPTSLDQVLIGATTAAEIRWTGRP